MTTPNPPAKIQLLYLTCTELVANYGIFDTQVKGLLKVLARRQGPALRLHLFSLVPVLRLLKWRVEVVFSRYRADFHSIRQDLATDGVASSIKPLATVYPLDGWRPLEMIVALPPAVLLLLRYVRREQINLLHCRSYHAGLLGLIIHRLAGVPYIFDPRSSWLGEQLLAGKIRPGSPSYRLWKRLEQAIAAKAFACVVVSEPMRADYQAVAQRIEVIHTTAGEMHFQEGGTLPDLPAARQLDQLRAEHTLLAFNAGTFNRWNNLDHLLLRYQALLEIEPTARLVIITRTAAEVIQQAMQRHNLSPEQALLMSLPSQLVPVVLRHCHYGLLVRPYSAESVKEISVKFGEYLAAGLPVICDDYIGGAAQVIRQHQVGALLSRDWSQNRLELARLHDHYPQLSQKCRLIAKSLFSVQVHAEKYANLYQAAVDAG